MTFFCGTCGSSVTKKRNDARAAAGSGDGNNGGPVRTLALFFAFNFVGIRQEEGILHVDHEEEACNTITITKLPLGGSNTYLPTSTWGMFFC